MRICMMAALIILGIRFEMPWYYWLIIMVDFSAFIARAVYSAMDSLNKN